MTPDGGGGGPPGTPGIYLMVGAVGLLVWDMLLH